MICSTLLILYYSTLCFMETVHHLPCLVCVGTGAKGKLQRAHYPFYKSPSDAPPTLVNLKAITNLSAWMDVPDNVYVGRACRAYHKPSFWQNPFRISANCTREQAISRYELYLRTNTKMMNKLFELSGKTLGCWCAPLKCHGNALISAFNELYYIDNAYDAPVSTK